MREKLEQGRPGSCAQFQGALGWLIVCYPATFLACMAGAVAVLSDASFAWLWLPFYLVLLSSLRLCALHGGPARWAFSLALAAATAHGVMLARCFCWSGLERPWLLYLMVLVHASVGLAGMGLARAQERQLLMWGFVLSTVLATSWAGDLIARMPGWPWILLGNFYGQAILLGYLRQEPPLPAEGTGLTPDPGKKNATGGNARWR